MSARDMDIALRLGQPCPWCHEPWQRNDRAMVIPNVNEHGEAELRFMHIACLIRDTAGDEAADAWLDQWRD